LSYVEVKESTDLLLGVEASGLLLESANAQHLREQVG
jgi:hypothetical protein